jgi:hypothetical protein
MRYSIYTGVQNQQINIKKMLIAFAVAIAGVFAISNLTAKAAYCDQSGNGCDAASNAGAHCGTGAGSGAFGAFGDKGDVTHDFGVNNPGSNGKPGADGHQTGINNSALCGNRQGNL